MGKCSFGQLTDFGLANLKLFNRTNTIIKVSFYLSIHYTDVGIKVVNVGSDTFGNPILKKVL